MANIAVSTVAKIDAFADSVKLPVIVKSVIFNAAIPSNRAALADFVTSATTSGSIPFVTKLRFALSESTTSTTAFDKSVIILFLLSLSIV